MLIDFVGCLPSACVLAELKLSRFDGLMQKQVNFEIILGKLGSYLMLADSHTRICML